MTHPLAITEQYILAPNLLTGHRYRTEIYSYSINSRLCAFSLGFYLLARFEGFADRKVYNANGYFISGHSLEHLCLSMVSFILTLMLSFRSIRIARYLIEIRLLFSPVQILFLY